MIGQKRALYSVLVFYQPNPSKQFSCVTVFLGEAWLQSIKHFYAIKYNYMLCWNNQMFSVALSRCLCFILEGYKPIYTSNKIHKYLNNNRNEPS